MRSSEEYIEDMINTAKAVETLRDDKKIWKERAMRHLTTIDNLKRKIKKLTS